MKFGLTRIELSRNDLKKGLQLPKELNESLAEDIGIMIGDGQIGIHKTDSGVNYQICISGDAISDYDYLNRYVWQLKKKLYNLEFPIFFVGKKRTEVRLQTYSKGLISFYSQIGLPLGKKLNIRVPKIIKQGNEKIKKAFLRGFADTDGGLILRKKPKNNGYYPSIKLGSSSRFLIEDICKMLTQLGFTYTASYNFHSIHPKTGAESVFHEIALNGFKKVEQWMQLIGSSNMTTNKRFLSNQKGNKRAHRDLNSRHTNSIFC